MATKLFKIIEPGRKRPSQGPQIILVQDNWDDWFEFSTLYFMVFIDANGNDYDIGQLKIGEFNMDKGQRRPAIPTEFNRLNKKFFSVGQDSSYYENLTKLGDDFRDQVLKAVHDIADDPDIYEKAVNERVTRISLLRSVTPTTVKNQFRRLAQGGARLSNYAFTYTSPSTLKNVPPISLSFRVEPKSNPPTNINVLIGRNGVGKTYLLENMISSLINQDGTTSQYGQFISDTAGSSELFANLVSVTFSAFDDSEPLPEQKDKIAGIHYSYIGLKREKKDKNPAPKSPVQLKNEFVKSAWNLKNSSKISRWVRAVQKLEADPIFNEADVTQISIINNENEFSERASYLFKKLSSGHKIVLLTITRLVEAVEERSLILIDEPEAHLHPPLLSAFIRALSDLLVTRNGVSIIATHSPVVLQEVPSSCVWKLRRNGSVTVVERLDTESFGENVGILTSQVFGLEVTQSGFHNLLTEVIARADDYDSVIQYFNNQVGMEARAIIRGLLSLKNNEG